MIENLTRVEYDALLRQDFATFAMRCFHDLNPQATLAMNWHIEVIAAKLAAVRQGKIRRLIINLPPRHLKSLLDWFKMPFPAWGIFEYTRRMAEEAEQRRKPPPVQTQWAKGSIEWLAEQQKSG